MSKKTWYAIHNSAPANAASAQVSVVSIHDEIGAYGVSAKDFMAEFRAIDPNAQIVLSVHSPGGDVFDGLAIYNTIKSVSNRVTARIEGLAASAASLVAMAAGKIVMPENSYMMIHNPSAFAWGDEQDLRDIADILSSMKKTMLNIYMQRTGADEQTVSKMLDEETWITGAEAVALGFADETAEAIKIAACTNPDVLGKFKSMPQALSVQVALPAEPPVVMPQAMQAANVIAACAQAGHPQLAEGLVRAACTESQVAAELKRAADIKAFGEAAKQPELAQNLIALNASADIARACMDLVRSASEVAIVSARSVGTEHIDATQTRQPDHMQIYASRKPAVKSL